MTSRDLPDSLLREALALLSKYSIASAAAPHATRRDGKPGGISLSAMQKRADAARLKFGVAKPEVEGKSAESIGTGEALLKASRESVLRKEIARLKVSLKVALEDYEFNRLVWEEITRFTQRTPEIPEWGLKPSIPGSPGTPIAMWSDWHWGETVKGPEVRNLNAFNKAISHARLRKLVEKTIELCFDHMKNPDYERLVLCLMGDMISGIIHEELQDTNHEYIMETLFDLFDQIVWAIGELLKVFKHMLVYCVVGNHGRMGKRPRYKGKVKTNYEWLLYKQLESYFKADERIKFFIPDSADIHFSVNGTRFLLTHGDTLGTKGGDGIIGAIGPIMRGRVKIGGAEARVKQDFDVMLIGHWHQWIPFANNGIVVNGSMKGYDEFAMLAIRAPFQVPIQGLLFVHPTYGVTTQWPVFLEKEKQ